MASPLQRTVSVTDLAGLRRVGSDYGRSGTGTPVDELAGIATCRSVIVLATTIRRHMAFSVEGETWYCLP